MQQKRKGIFPSVKRIKYGGKIQHTSRAGPRWQYDGVTPEEMEERFQRLMDEYAGGVGQFFKFNEEQLNYALRHIKMMRGQVNRLFATDLHDLVLVHDVIDRLDVAEVVVMHLREGGKPDGPAGRPERIILLLILILIAL